MLISLVSIKYSIQEFFSPIFLLFICILLGFAIYVGIIFIIRKSTLEEIWALIPKKKLACNLAIHLMNCLFLWIKNEHSSLSTKISFCEKNLIYLRGCLKKGYCMKKPSSQWP
jgi:hypothetical protein